MNSSRFIVGILSIYFWTNVIDLWSKAMKMAAQAVFEGNLQEYKNEMGEYDEFI